MPGIQDSAAASTYGVAVVAVGDELLLGDIVNGNLAWIGRTLAEAGIPVVGGFEVGDGVDDIVAVLRAALAGDRTRAVLVTGGLGPTSDDRTRQALASLAGVPLHRDPGLQEVIARWYADRGREAPPNVWAQADVPQGARSVGNAAGTAPGIAIMIGSQPLYALPGVPAELHAMMRATVVPELVRLAGSPAALVTRQLRVAVQGESAVAHQLAPVEAELPDGVTLAYLASPGEVRVRLTGTDVALLDSVRDRAARLLGRAVSGFDDEVLPATVLRLLAAQQATVAVAESLTGGALASALVDVPGSSVAFRGGVVAYASELKTELLGVDAGLLAAGGAVQAEVAVQMARGVARRLGTTYGVATTGVAGPDPVDGVAPGTAYVAVAGAAGSGRSAGGEDVVELALPGPRDRVRRLVVVHALDLLRRRLLDAEQLL